MKLDILKKCKNTKKSTKMRILIEKAELEITKAIKRLGRKKKICKNYLKGVSKIF